MSSVSGAASAKAPQKSSTSKVIGVALIAIALGGGSTWFFLQRGRAAGEAKAAESSSTPKYIVHLEGFTVNLADQEATHFLRVTIDLGIDHLPEGADLDKPAQSVPIPRIRDSILSVLTVCKADALLTPEGKAQLKKNLLDSLNKNVPEIGVKDIYFTEFLVQR
ncbi:MAG: flagellar basal body-associated FliL family protein [Candidatus Acidiferrum sp.]